MSRDELFGLVDAWVAWGWLRPLDRAFMGFLEELAAPSEPLFLLAVALASHQLGRGHVCLDLAATLADPNGTLSLPPEGEGGEDLPVLPVRVLAGQTLAHWRRVLAASPLVGDGPGNSPLVLDGERLYLRRYWQYEQQVARAILGRLDWSAGVSPTLCLGALDGGRRDAGAPSLRGQLDELFPRQPGQILPDWQKIACALAARGAFTVITGGPGTGKTTTVVRLLALLQSAALSQGHKLRIRLAAPTGKAAARLTESIGTAIQRLPEAMREEIPTEAVTLHRLLGARMGTRHLRHHAGNPLHADWVVVDEASMVDLEMMAALLNALAAQTRLVLLGDKDQLASVEAGAVLGDLCREAGYYRADTVAWIAATAGEDVAAFQGETGVLAQQTALLRVSHRFRESSGIGQLALAVNAGDMDAVRKVWGRQPAYPDIARISLHGEDDPRLGGLAVEGGAGHFPLAETPARGYRHYLELIRSRRPAPDADSQAHGQWAGLVLDAFDQFQLLCALRRGPWGVEGLNWRIATALQQAGLIAQTWGWYEGRPVLVTRNDYSLGLMNGDIGVTLSFPDASGAADAKLRVAFRQPDHSIKLVLPSRLNDVETVYAMTVHKSQGSEFTHVGLVLPDKPNPVLTRELVYTGITRARQWFSLLAPHADILAQAVGQQVRRSGGLAGLLAAADGAD